MAGENFSGCFFYRDLKYGKRWFILLEGNFKSPQKFLKFRIAILLRSVFGGYLFNSHAQTTAFISSTLIF